MAAQPDGGFSRQPRSVQTKRIEGGSQDSNGLAIEVRLCGGRTASILPSLTSTCRRHAVDPQLYFTQLLTNLPVASDNDLDLWLPDQWKLRQDTTMAELSAHRTWGSLSAHGF